MKPAFFNSQAGKNSFLLITPSGARVELRQVGSSALYQSVDSSYLLLDANTMTLRSPEGTKLSYVWTQNGEYVCTEIKDRNGNFISANYDSLGRIDTVVDTLARIIKFNYTGSDLSSITQTWTIGGQAETHTWASFSYANTPIETSFTGLTVVGPQNGGTIRALTKVTFADNSHYDFDYTSWGQVWKISQYATNNHLLNYRAYNLRGSPMLPTGAENDCPRFTQRRDWAEYWNRDVNGIAQEAITTFDVPAPSAIPNTSLTGTLAQVTAPDGVMQKIYYGSSATAPGWQNGLVLLTETYDASSGNPVKQRWVAKNWTQDDLNVSYSLNPRVIETNSYDPSGNRARTRVDYAAFNLSDATSCRYPQDTYEYQADATTVLRRTHVEYKMTSTYTDRRILGLPSAKYVCDGSQGEVPCGDSSGSSLVSKVGFQYDETGSIQGSDAPVQYNNPNLVEGRANLSSAKRFDVLNVGQYTAASFQYNSTGSLVKTTDAAGRQTQISYVDAFAAAGTTLDTGRPITLAYPTLITDAGGFTSSVRYHYDLGRTTWKQTPLPNVTDNQPGPQQKIEYDSFGRLVKVRNLVNDAYTRYVYGPNYVETLSTVNSVADEALSLRVLDGHGRVIGAASNHPGSTGGFSGELIHYDLMGRVIKQSNTTETSITISGAALNPYTWQATGDDDLNNGGNGWVYTQQSYDWKGRPRVTTKPSITSNPNDVTTSEASYAGCGCAGGEAVTLTDEGTLDGGVAKRRQQKIYSDVLGRAFKTEVLNWEGGTVYSTTVTTYNARDQITLVRQYQGSDQSGVYQDTSMSYDGYGRLQTKHLPMQQVDLNNGASTDHTTWTYNPDDTINSITDARGASATYAYNARNLVTQITYYAPTIVAPGSPVPAVPTVNFDYDAAGNRLWMDEDGQRRMTYHYDDLSRMDWEDRQFPGLSGTFRLAYEYSLAGGVKKVIDQTAGTSFSTSYDSGGRVSRVNTVGYGGSTEQFASQFQYRAWGAMKAMAYGNNTSVSISYNNRLQMANYSVNGAIAQWFVPPRPMTIAASYQYHADGQVKFVQDQGTTNSIRDRAYKYDQVGRLAEGLSGTEARDFVNGASGGPSDGPYRHSYTYDAWDNTITQGGRYWSRNSTSTTNYNQFNRNPDWSYDSDGNLISRNQLPNAEEEPRYSYDAAGRDTKVEYTQICEVQPQGLFQTNVYTRTKKYDGDGQLVGYVQTRTINGTMAGGWPVTGFYLTSSVLGGRVISSYDGQGGWKDTQVYVGAERIGSLGKTEDGSSFFNTFRYADPLTGDEVTTMKSNVLTSFKSQSTLDTNGVGVPLADPFPPPEEDGDGSCVIWDDSYESKYNGHGNGVGAVIPIEGSAGCVLDGLPINCSFISSESSVHCLNNDCGPHLRTLTLRDRGVIQYSKTILVRPGEWGWNGERDFSYRRNVEGPWTRSGPDRRHHATPQKAERVLVPIVNFKKLLQDRLAYGDCADYVAKLINKAAELSEGKNDAISTDVMTLYNKINRQPRGGFFLNQPAIWEGKRVSATAQGNILWGNAKVTIDSGGGFSDRPEGYLRLPADYGIAGIHEIIHLAGKNALYSEELLSEAVRAVEPDKHPVGVWWEWGLRNHCLPPHLRGNVR